MYLFKTSAHPMNKIFSDSECDKITHMRTQNKCIYISSFKMFVLLNLMLICNQDLHECCSHVGGV